ncbi:hypothetical protein L915_03591, partial [Phytophthora nicotianae]
SEEGGNEQVGRRCERVQCADWQDDKRAVAEKGGRREGVSGAAGRPRTSGTDRSIVKAD